MFRILIFLFGIASSAIGSPSGAVAQADVPTAATPGDELTVYIMTMGPGANVWERFGHNAIWIRDAETGTDVAYNYGMFSFEQENFLLRFIQGQMYYWMEGFDALLTSNFYVQQDRSVWAQELNLRPEQRVELRDFLEWNSRPENRFYRYDYYRDNCSTRVRDAIDRVLGGEIQRQTVGIPTGTTYRDHTRRLTAEDPLLYTGLMVGLGEPVDQEISAWEEMFLPMQLRDWFNQLTIVDRAGQEIPLVRSEEVIYLSPSESVLLEGVPSRFAGYLFGGVIIGLGIFVSSWYATRRRDAGFVFRTLAMGWSIVAGLLGLLLFGLWAFTDHQAAYRNENLFFFSPLLFFLALLIPAAVRRRGSARDSAVGLAMLVALSSIIGTLLGLLPSFNQANGEMIALALPINLGLAAGLWRIRSAGITERILPDEEDAPAQRLVSTP